MKTKIVSLFIFIATISNAETLRVGDQPDYALTVTRAHVIWSGATSGSNEITGTTQLEGGYVYTPEKDEANFEMSSSKFAAQLKIAIEADGWKSTSYWIKPSGFLPGEIRGLFSKNGVLLDIFVCLYPVEKGQVGVCYTQGSK